MYEYVHEYACTADDCMEVQLCALSYRRRLSPDKALDVALAQRLPLSKKATILVVWKRQDTLDVCQDVHYNMRMNE
jgi:hypothetical protein